MDTEDILIVGGVAVAAYFLFFRPSLGAIGQAPNAMGSTGIGAPINTAQQPPAASTRQITGGFADELAGYGSAAAAGGVVGLGAYGAYQAASTIANAHAPDSTFQRDVLGGGVGLKIGNDSRFITLPDGAVGYGADSRSGKALTLAQANAQYARDPRSVTAVVDHRSATISATRNAAPRPNKTPSVFSNFTSGRLYG